MTGALLISLGVGALGGIVVWAAVSLIEEWEAEYANQWHDLGDTWDEHVASALMLTEPTPIHDRLFCEQIERNEGWV